MGSWVDDYYYGVCAPDITILDDHFGTVVNSITEQQKKKKITIQIHKWTTRIKQDGMKKKKYHNLKTVIEIVSQSFSEVETKI